MKKDIILSGVGGQGVLSIAAIIAHAAIAEGLFVRQSEVHGMAQRGGAVLAHLRIADRPIFCDLVPHGAADLIISMEPLESLRYASWLSPTGAIVSAVEPFINIPNYPSIEEILRTVSLFPVSRLIKASELAKAAGNARAVNVAMVGAASSFLPLKEESLEAAISTLFAAKDAAIGAVNQKAFQLGKAAS